MVSSLAISSHHGRVSAQDRFPRSRHGEGTPTSGVAGVAAVHCSSTSSHGLPERARCGDLVPCPPMGSSATMVCMSNDPVPKGDQISARFDRARRELVRTEIVARGIEDERVIEAISTVRRERFVPEAMVEFAYEDSPLPIGSGQTISQPFIVALMAQAAEITPNDKVLEVGTGSGYGAAVLAELAAGVWTIERHQGLASTAAERLRAEGYNNVQVRVGDGTLGWSEEAPFDAIIVTAAAPRIPAALKDQLVDGGRMILPMGPERRGQSLLRVRRTGRLYRSEDLGAVRFVPLVGAQGFHSVKPHSARPTDAAPSNAGPSTARPPTVRRRSTRWGF